MGQRMPARGPALHVLQGSPNPHLAVLSGAAVGRGKLDVVGPLSAFVTSGVVAEAPWRNDTKGDHGMASTWRRSTVFRCSRAECRSTRSGRHCLNGATSIPRRELRRCRNLWRADCAGASVLAVGSQPRQRSPRTSKELRTRQGGLSGVDPKRAVGVQRLRRMLGAGPSPYFNR